MSLGSIVWQAQKRIRFFIRSLYLLRKVIYEQKASSLFGVYCRALNTSPATSFKANTPWGAKIASNMTDVEMEFARYLLHEINDKKIPGSIVEFGVFEGAWLEFLIATADILGMKRDFFWF